MKKSSKTKRFSLPSFRTALLIYSALASTAALGMFGLFFSSYMSQQRIFAEQDFKQLVRDAQFGLYVSPIRSTTVITFPEMNLSIPATNDTKDLLYEFEEADSQDPQSFPASASIASRQAINNLSKTVEQFPCSRLVEIVFDNKQDRSSEMFTFAFEQKLSDGRVMHVFQNTGNCGSVWGSLTPEKVIGLLKQARVVD